MPSVSNIAVGALVAGSAASKARHGMNESIARLSTGMRSMYGGDAAGQSVANTLEARSKSWAVAARNAEDGISAAQTAESALLEIAALAQRLRELGIQADNAALLDDDNDEAALDAEAVAVADAIDAIVEKATFNGVAVLSAGDLTRSIGVTDDPGENPLNPAVKAARRRQSDFALGINRTPISPEEAKAYAILAAKGFKYHNKQNRRIALDKTINRGWEFSVQNAGNILYSAANAGELDRDVVRKVLYDMHQDLMARTL